MKVPGTRTPKKIVTSRAWAESALETKHKVLKDFYHTRHITIVMLEARRIISVRSDRENRLVGMEEHRENLDGGANEPAIRKYSSHPEDEAVSPMKVCLIASMNERPKALIPIQ